MTQRKLADTRAAQLNQLEDTEPPPRTTTADLDQLRRELHAALKHAAPIRAKTVLQAMIDSIRVGARGHIEPTFRVPAVRVDNSYMVSTMRYTNQPFAAPAIDVG